MIRSDNGLRRTFMMLVALFLIFCFSSGLAETRWTKTSFVGAKLQIENGIAKCSGTVEAFSVEACYLTVRLYKYQSGSWQQVRMWSAYEVSDNVSVKGNCTLAESGRYKVVATSTIDDEVVSQTSQICYY